MRSLPQWSQYLLLLAQLFLLPLALWLCRHDRSDTSAQLSAVVLIFEIVFCVTALLYVPPQRTSSETFLSPGFIDFLLSSMCCIAAGYQFFGLVSGRVDPNTLDRICAIVIVMVFVSLSWVFYRMGQRSRAGALDRPH